LLLLDNKSDTDREKVDKDKQILYYITVWKLNKQIMRLLWQITFFVHGQSK